MFATTFEYNYKLDMWGADGTVYMWVSKTHAARLESSNLSRPTKSMNTVNKNFISKKKDFILFLYGFRLSLNNRRLKKFNNILINVS